MSLEHQISTCSQHYKKWKNLALTASNKSFVEKAMNRAFFWLELQTAFMALWSIEQTRGKDPTIKQKLIIAKANLSKKLANYADELLKEMR